ncbi:MAG: hypothetical protein PQJ61_13250 [Spirochaetales bacterium]|uniref:Uncharacterized protein n=1 Tax=Candidatus Thalassospirochaeta sargassi TaxID=3119039 RepID=A0AAJ1IGF5_9SPIO|nr:hypothetical protein [Spirochaetales bacterium]
MEKFALAILFVMLVLPLSLFAAEDYGFACGDWEIKGNRIYQEDADTGIAKAWLVYPQKGVVEYIFNVMYEEGLFEDGHAGFGLHIFVDKPAKGFSWGEGKSYLLWLNYDENPESDDIPEGLSAQLYRSDTNWDMELLDSISLKALEKVVMKYPKSTEVPIRITVDGRSGVVKIYDPVTSGLFYTMNLDNKKSLSGNYVTLRTNSGAFSFGY